MSTREVHTFKINSYFIFRIWNCQRIFGKLSHILRAQNIRYVKPPVYILRQCSVRF